MSGKATQGATAGIGYSDDVALSEFLTLLLLEHLLEQTEGNGGLGRGARLGDDDDAELVSAHQVHQVVEVILADVVAGKDHLGAIGALVSGKVVAQGLDNGLSTQITAADADGDDILALLAQLGGTFFNGLQLRLVDTAGQVEPSQEIVAFTAAVFQHLLGSQSSVVQGLYIQPLKGVFADNLNFLVHNILMVIVVNSLYH